MQQLQTLIFVIEAPSKRAKTGRRLLQIIRGLSLNKGYFAVLISGI
jgi:hypothetical protein